MSYGFDLVAELATGVQNRQNAWTFIRRFAEAWLVPISNGDGYNDQELGAAEKHLGFKLPTALYEAYMLFGKRVDLCGTMNFLKPPGELCTYDGLLIYHAENQGVWQRYIRLADLYLEDPPTLHSCEDGHEEHIGGVPWFERISAAFIEMVFNESLFNADVLTAHGELREDDMDEVERRFVSSGFPLIPTEGPECSLGRHRWYLGDEVIVCIDPHLPAAGEKKPERASSRWSWSSADIHVRGRTPEAIDSTYKQLPEEWFQHDPW